MSKHYELNGVNYKSLAVFGKARGNQLTKDLDRNFDKETLRYLSERVINHLADSVMVEHIDFKKHESYFNDYSFITAPAYKAFEGFLFQLAQDLKLQGNPKYVGTYFNEKAVDEAIDAILSSLGEKAETTTKLDPDEKSHIRDMVSEMKRFLVHYRHTPAHFHGEMIDTPQKAEQNIHGIYRIINETTKTLLGAKLIVVTDQPH